MDGNNNGNAGIPAGTPMPAAPGVPATSELAAPAVPAAADIDYEKLASVIDGRTAATEKKVINGYLKQQGLSEADFDEAVQLYRNYRASQEPDIDGLQAELNEAYDAYDEVYSDMLYSQAELAAYQSAGELGVDAKSIPYLMKMADLSNVVSEGQIDREALVESLSNVLEDMPQLKISTEEGKQPGFKIGADTSGQKDPNELNTELANIFGVNKKG